MKEKKNKRRNLYKFIGVICFFIIIIVLWFCLPFSMNKFDPENDDCEKWECCKTYEYDIPEGVNYVALKKACWHREKCEVGEEQGRCLKKRKKTLCEISMSTMSK